MTLPFLTPIFSDDLRAAGIPAPWGFGLADRVRFHELDALNHVNNAAYLSWFENFRIAYLTDYGISDYRQANRTTLVIRNLGIDYRAPLHLNESYVVVGRSTQMRRTSWTMEYAVYREAELCMTSFAVIVMLEDDVKTKCALPEQMRKTLIERDGAVQL
jgi:acyl-CoA thioester hydrolase